MTAMRLSRGKSTVAESYPPATREAQGHAGSILLPAAARQRSPISIRAAKRAVVASVLFRVAYNPRLLEFLAASGNDCHRANDDRPKEVGHIQRMSDAWLPVGAGSRQTLGADLMLNIPTDLH